MKLKDTILIKIMLGQRWLKQGIGGPDGFHIQIDAIAYKNKIRVKDI
ncbi:hypothetical protein [Anaerosporobacter sp.]